MREIERYWLLQFANSTVHAPGDHLGRPFKKPLRLSKFLRHDLFRIVKSLFHQEEFLDRKARAILTSDHRKFLSYANRHRA